MEAELFLTNRHDECNGRFSRFFCECGRKRSRLLSLFPSAKFFSAVIVFFLCVAGYFAVFSAFLQKGFKFKTNFRIISVMEAFYMRSKWLPESVMTRWYLLSSTRITSHLWASEVHYLVQSRHCCTVSWTSRIQMEIVFIFWHISVLSSCPGLDVL